MRQILTILLPTIQLTSCVDKPKPDSRVSSDDLKKLDSAKSVFIDSGVSRVEILSGENSGYGYKTIETNYKLVFLNIEGDLKHYFAKYLTTTKTCTGCEGQERNIDIKLNSFDNPTKTVRTINKDCDALIQDAHTYKTIVYGCCGGEDQIDIYDYESRPIIEGDSKIIIGDIPNSGIQLFVAYKQELDDSTNEEIFDYVGKRISEGDTALYGRVTYQMMENYWPTAGYKPTATRHDLEHSKWYSKVHKDVLSKTMNPDSYQLN